LDLWHPETGPCGISVRLNFRTVCALKLPKGTRSARRPQPSPRCQSSYSSFEPTHQRTKEMRQANADRGRIVVAGVLSYTACHKLEALGITLMSECDAAPIVRVIFACPRCAAAFEAVQSRRPGSGTFTCKICGDQVHSWSGDYDFTDWSQHPRVRGIERQSS
jgi:hypothetical protein